MGIANLDDLHDDIYINLLKKGISADLVRRPDYFA